MEILTMKTSRHDQIKRLKPHFIAKGWMFYDDKLSISNNCKKNCKVNTKGIKKNMEVDFLIWNFIKYFEKIVKN